MTQTGTQTSPENSNQVSLKGNFSIGTINRDDKISPKLNRKERTTTKVRPKRAISPANIHQMSSVSSKVNYTGTETIKQAMSPSVAESLRAVFAAFLWHEGMYFLYIYNIRELTLSCFLKSINRFYCFTG